MTDITVIGMGDMGSALARTLLASGYNVTVWNRSADKCDALVSEGAHAASSPAEAIAASPITVTCITSHDRTISLVRDLDTLEGKTIIELSTGGAAEARELTSLISEKGGAWLVGIINGYPTGIGSQELVLAVVGEQQTWENCKAQVTALGGSSILVGADAGMLATLFAALFTTRQGFMFGMIYGALVCRKAGLPLDVYAKLIPITMGVLPSYHQYFADTAPSGSFDNPPATMTTYAAALDDVLKTFDEVGAANEMPKLFSDLAHKGVDAGLQDKALTALVELLNK